MKKKKEKRPPRSIGVQFGKRVVLFKGPPQALGMFIDAIRSGLELYRIEPYKERKSR